MQRDLRSREEKRRAVLSDSTPRTTLSFYKYFKVSDPEAFRAELLRIWGKLGCLGRIYVAHEGINAQMNVPKPNWEQFDAWMKSQPDLADIPYKIAVEEGEAPSFYKLTIKVRPKLLPMASMTLVLMSRTRESTLPLKR